MTTLKDVAERAGVSVSTVSYVLRGKKKVRSETQRRIEEAIEELDYYPNLMASGLRTNRFQTVGVMIADFDERFAWEVFSAIEEELERHNYCVIACNSENDARRERKNLRRLLARNIDGLLLINTGKNDFSGLQDFPMPIIGIDRYLGPGFLTIRTDSVACGKIAAERLARTGRTRLAFLGNEQYVFSEQRFEGFVAGLREAGCNEMPVKLQVDSLINTTGIAKAEAVLGAVLEESRETPFDGIYCCMDYYAVGALHALQRRNIDVPGQVSVIGNDDVISSDCYPALTTVAQPKKELGRQAVKELLGYLEEGRKPEKGVRYLKPRLIARDSG